MQPGPLIGIAFAIFAILGGNILEGGHIGSVLGGPAAIIVLGGTIGAVLVQYPMSTLAEAMRAAGRTFKKPSLDGHKLIDEIVDYANRARRDGILALEKVAESASDPFLAKAIMMAVDGADSTTLRDTMEITISKQEEHGEDAVKAFEAAGGYSPTVGIIGAVLGLIHVMSNLSDIAAVGSGIAAAFVATIYGVAIANIIFLPLGGRIKLRLREEITLKELTLVGRPRHPGGHEPQARSRAPDRVRTFTQQRQEGGSRRPGGRRGGLRQRWRRTKEEAREHVNHERWLISYADFITLLFAFFVVMFAVSQVDSKRLGRFTEAFSKAVGEDMMPEKGKGILPDQAIAPSEDNTKGDSLPPELEQVRQNLLALAENFLRLPDPPAPQRARAAPLRQHLLRERRRPAQEAGRGGAPRARSAALVAPASTSASRGTPTTGPSATHAFARTGTCRRRARPPCSKPWPRKGWRLPT